MTKARRRCVTVCPEDAVSGSGGRPRLWAYGVQWLARVAGLDDPQRVREAITRAGGKEPPLDPANPVEAVAWALTVRGHKRLANRVRRLLSEPG